MDEGKVYTKEITKEQYEQLMLLKRQNTVKNILTGIHSALIAVALNLILYMAQEVYAPDDKNIGIFGSFLIGLFVIRRMAKILNERSQEYSDKIKSIIFTE